MSTITTTVRDANGTVQSTETRTVTFDSQRQIINEKDTSGNEIRYTRNTQTWVTRKEWWKNWGTVTAPNLVLDHAIDYTYDSKGNTLTQTEMDSETPATSTFTYTTTYTYYPDGNLWTEENPLNQVTTYTYNTKKQVLIINGPQGNIANTYYSDGNLETSTDAAGAVTSYTYYPNSNLHTVTDARLKVTTYTYDGNENLASVTDSTNGVTSFTYDVNGNMLTQTSAGKTTTYTYDTMNRVKTIKDPLNNTTTYTYDANGNRDTVTDANGKVTRYAYNDEGQVATVTDALQKVTTYNYGGTGCPSCGGTGGSNLVALTDANAHTTDWQYDFMNRLVHETDPLNKTTYYTYNSKGNLDYKFDANGNRIDYSYDALKRLTGITYPGGATVTYTYDGTGRIHTVANGDVTYTYGYDAAGRTTSVADSRGYTVDYEYDAAGRRTKMTVQKGTADERIFTYTYDDANRPTGITSSAGSFTYAYDAAGRRSSLAYPNQITATYAYDDAGRLTGLTHAGSGSTIASFGYTLDNVGNRLSKTSTETEQYQYDDIYRLLSVTSSKPESFTYDNVGNRLTGPGNKDTAYLYNAENQMTHGRQFTYAYDNNGNQISRTLPNTPTAAGKSWTLNWDYENRLKSMVRVNGSETRTINFKYDPSGRRIEKHVVISLDGTPATTTTSTWKYVYDGDNIVLEILTDASGTTKTYYTQGARIDEHLALERNGPYYYYHADGLGSVASITDANRTIVQSYTYDSFGMPKPANNTFVDSYTYTGREWDKETGLYYYRARYYDSIEGRFIQKDPIGFQGGINQFIYTLNNPVTHTDPKGLATWVGGEASGGVNIILLGAGGGFGTLTNVSTGEACIVSLKCGKIGPGIIASGGTKAIGSVCGPRCGKDIGGLNVSFAFEIIAPGVPGLGGNVGYGGGVGGGVGVGPEGGGGFFIGIELCWVSVKKCWNTPKECKQCSN
ncbi:RHS repeat-associated core domain-containing protein [Geotalea toluenoxydans]|uniref:RHS repeat-associated core domain-containing protein n=1 Tax=Geotalea toluenoxydans TaxID=421624 RepID=UPI0006D22B69|nr:RHS repeat-associated core domain-containing protein [Geotalea toluenoxydans]